MAEVTVIIRVEGIGGDFEVMRKESSQTVPLRTASTALERAVKDAHTIARAAVEA